MQAQIFSHFCQWSDSLLLSKRDYCVIDAHIDAYDFTRSVLRPYKLNGGYKLIGLEELKSLRAVSKALYYPATRALCQESFTGIGPFNLITVDRIQEHLLASDNGLIPMIRNLRIHLGNIEDWRQEPKRICIIRDHAFETEVEDTSLEQRIENPGVFKSFMVFKSYTKALPSW